MQTNRSSHVFEYPDAAGYPDGVGFLDEGTAARETQRAEDAVPGLDRPSVDADSEIVLHRQDDERVYRASAGGREVATLRYDETDDRIVLLATTVVPEFRGRGLAAELIADALDDIRASGKRVTVYCDVVAAFMANNQQYSDLLAPEPREL